MEMLAKSIGDFRVDTTAALVDPQLTDSPEYVSQNLRIFHYLLVAQIFF